MYSLLVSGSVDGTERGTITVPGDRYLEYTSDPMKSQLRNLSNDAMECLKSWPCLVMDEGRSNEVACVAKLVSMSRSGGGLRLTVEPLRDQPKLLNDTIWKLRAELDIQQFEFSRKHLAVKDRDLFEVLGRAGHHLGQGVISEFREGPLPAPPRSQLIAAIDVIAAWSHTDIDRFLMECGAEQIAPRSLGGRKARATSIVKYAIDNPEYITAENDLFSALLVRRAQVNNSASNSLSAHTVPGEISTTASREEVSASPNRVFVVHGRDEVARGEVVSFLEGIGLEAIVLHEQPNMGRHLLTKFIDEAALVTFAIVLMTGDDVGGEKDGPQAPRARQNVILELGYFLAHLGQSKVCAIKTPGLETPSDFDGIVYISMDAEQQWKWELLRELKAARMPVMTS